MLESLEGRRGVIRAKPPLPALVGLFGAPTVVNNLLTLATVPAVLSGGAEAYAGLGVGRSRGTQVFQLAGNLARGGIVETAFGISLGELVYECVLAAVRDPHGLGAGRSDGVEQLRPVGMIGDHERQFDTGLAYASPDAHPARGKPGDRVAEPARPTVVDSRGRAEHERAGIGVALGGARSDRADIA